MNFQLAISHEDLTRCYLRLLIQHRQNEEFKAILCDLKVATKNLESLIDYSQISKERKESERF
jgi:hypothetical protein